MKYINIEIHDTEFENKFLLLYQNRTLLVGNIVADIVRFLINNKNNANEISIYLSSKYKQNINHLTIIEIIEKIDVFLNNNKKQSYTKVTKLFNPSKIQTKYLNFLFDKYFFYTTFFLLIIMNTIISKNIVNMSINSKTEWSIWLLLLFVILIVHELGHSFSANKFNVKCKEVGLGLYLIFPVLYIYLGETWKLKKEKRIIINLSGIYFQLILGIILFAFSSIYQSTIFTHLFFTNYSIAILNLNPFVKFDGYWVISDILDSKNLVKESNSSLKEILQFNFKNYKFIIYAILRISFLTFIFYYIIQILFSIICKFINKENLDTFEIIMITIITILLIKKIIKK